MLRAILALLFVSSVAYANPNELTISESRRALHSDSANAVTDQGLVGGSLGYARRLDLPIMPNLTLWAHGTFSWGGTDGEMFQTMTTNVGTIMLAGGGSARYQLHRLVAATARLDVGSERASLSISDSTGHTARDHGWGAMSYAAVGLDLFAINKPRFALGMRLELGYVATSKVEMTGKPDSDSSGTLQLQMTAASLGGLDLSGSTFAASVVAQF